MHTFWMASGMDPECVRWFKCSMLNEFAAVTLSVMQSAIDLEHRCSSTPTARFAAGVHLHVVTNL